MTRVFVCESITGGGLYLGSIDPPASACLRREGLAMLYAAVADFARVPGVEVTITWDPASRCPPPVEANEVMAVESAARFWTCFGRACRTNDFALVIAPELGGQLLQLVQTAADTGVRLLGPSPGFVRQAADKYLAARRWRARGIPTPATWLAGRVDAARLAEHASWVLKPRFGTGGIGVKRASHDIPLLSSGVRSTEILAQPWVEGVSLSVLLIGGSAGVFTTPPGVQRFEPGSMSYAGGVVPAHRHCWESCQRLAVAAVQALGDLTGIAGVDLVWTRQATDPQAWVIEVNPRLTTSYLGYRRLTRENLAGVILDIARGELPSVAWNHVPVCFEADGQWRRAGDGEPWVNA